MNYFDNNDIIAMHERNKELRTQAYIRSKLPQLLIGFAVVFGIMVGIVAYILGI